MGKSFLKKSEITKMSNAILHNKFILYFIFVVAVGNLFHFVFSQDLMSVGVFIAAGLLTSFFSKNMVVIMVVAMVVANVIRLGQGPEGFKTMEERFQNAIKEAEKANKEFMKEMDDEDDDDDDDDDDTDDEDNEDDEDEDDEEEDEDDAFRPSMRNLKKQSKKAKNKKK